MSSTSLVVLAGRAAELIGPLPCRTGNPQLWFSDLPAELEQAKALCEPCPLRGPCLAGAIERAEPHGVWGGQIFEKGALTPGKRTRGRPRKRPGSRAVTSASIVHDQAESMAPARAHRADPVPHRRG